MLDVLVFEFLGFMKIFWLLIFIIVFLFSYVVVILSFVYV